MNSETCKIVVAMGRERLTFRQQMINVSAEEKLREKFIDLTEEEKENGRLFDLNVEALTQYQGEKLERTTFDEKGDEVTEMIDAKDYFAEKTVLKERFAEYAVRGWINSMAPKLDFF